MISGKIILCLLLLGLAAVAMLLIEFFTKKKPLLNFYIFFAMFLLAIASCFDSGLYVLGWFMIVSTILHFERARRSGIFGITNRSRLKKIIKEELRGFAQEEIEDIMNGKNVSPQDNEGES